LSPAVSKEDAELVKTLLQAVGLAIEFPESQMDVITGLSGGGPAYVFMMIEAMADGGVKLGLPRDVALRLTAQTFKGAAEMILKTGEHPAVLKDRVTSPGGTTITGLATLENASIRAALINTVEAATLRSIELGQ
jgi:pyrroline-5-carboxylate reductase